MNDQDPATTTDAVHVLIVDDHPVVRHGLRELLSQDPAIVITGEAAGTSEALQLVQKSTPDLVLVDITLKDGSGIDLVKRLKSHQPSIKSLVVSMHDDALYAERVLAAGASGYVNKEEATDVLARAIQEVARGEVFLSAKTARRLSDRPAPPERADVARLSDRELEVFEMIGRGMTTREIAASLNLSVKTIETHRVNIKRKLGHETNTALIRHAVQWTMREHG